MKDRIRQIAHFSKSALFTIVIHGLLIGALLFGLWWPYSENTAKRGTVQPIKAQVISAKEIQKQVDQKQKKLEEQLRAAKELEDLKKKEEEKVKLEELEVQRKAEEKEKKELEEKKHKQEAEKLKLEQEKKHKEEEKLKLEQEKKHKEEEKKKKEAEDKKRKEEEKRKKEEAEKQRIAQEKRKKEAEEKRQREEALKKQLEAEQLTRTQSEAANALTALVDRIATAVENNWRRPLNSAAGLQAKIRVKVSRSGDVLSANVVKSSGDPFFDKSAELAVKKASPLPFPSDPKYYEFINEFDLLFKPDDF
jgi:colicin import membrane protein